MFKIKGGVVRCGAKTDENTIIGVKNELQYQKNKRR